VCVGGGMYRHAIFKDSIAHVQKTKLEIATWVKWIRLDINRSEVKMFQDILMDTPSFVTKRNCTKLSLTVLNTSEIFISVGNDEPNGKMASYMTNLRVSY
jgi:hypothetical protein